MTPGLPSDLLAQRPDIREAEAQLAAANANVETARAAFFPSISLTGEGGYQSAALQDAVAAGVGALQPGGRPDAADLRRRPAARPVRLQKGRQDELLQLYRKAIVNGFADVERALIAVQQTAAAGTPAARGGPSSRRAFEIAETRLREGTVDLVTVLNTQQTLFQAQDSWRRRGLRLQAVVSLFQALGGGWEKPKERRPPPRYR